MPSANLDASVRDPGAATRVGGGRWIGDKMTTLGDLQNLTMLAVAHLGARSWAAQIRTELRETAGREVSISTVFVTLTRLEDRGLLVSHPGDSPERGGRVRRIFSLTPLGWEALRAARAASERMWARLEEGR